MPNQLFVQPEVLPIEERSALEVILGNALQGLASDLRTHDLNFFVRALQAQRFSVLSQLIDAAAECHFAPGAVSFAWEGSAASPTIRHQTVRLTLEFVHGHVHLFFDLILNAGFGAVEIIQMYAQSATRSRCEILARALEDAGFRDNPRGAVRR